MTTATIIAATATRTEYRLTDSWGFDIGQVVTHADGTLYLSVCGRSAKVIRRGEIVDPISTTDGSPIKTVRDLRDVKSCLRTARRAIAECAA